MRHFGQYGEIIDSVIMKDRHTSQPRGFGFITYSDTAVVDKVIEETHVINGKQVSYVFHYSVSPFRSRISLFFNSSFQLCRVNGCTLYT